MNDERNLWGPGPDDIAPPTPAEIELALESVVHSGQRSMHRRRVAAGSVTAAAVIVIVAFTTLSLKSTNNSQVAHGGTTTSSTSTTLGIGIGVTSTTNPTTPPSRLIASVGTGDKAAIVSLNPSTGKTVATLFSARDSNEFTSCAPTVLANAAFDTVRLAHMSNAIYFTTTATCSHNNGGLFKIDGDGKNFTFVTAEVLRSFALSPDDSHAAFFDALANPSSVDVIGLDTGVKRVVDTNAVEGGIDWQATGDNIVYPVTSPVHGTQIAIASAFASKLERNLVGQPTSSIGTPSTKAGLQFEDTNPHFGQGNNVYFERSAYDSTGKHYVDILGMFDHDGNLVQKIADGNLNAAHRSLVVDASGHHYLFITFGTGIAASSEGAGDLKLALNGGSVVTAGSDFRSAAW